MSPTLPPPPPLVTQPDVILNPSPQLSERHAIDNTVAHKDIESPAISKPHNDNGEKPNHTEDAADMGTSKAKMKEVSNALVHRNNIMDSRS